MLFNWFNSLGVRRKMIISNLLIIIIPFIVLLTALSIVWGVIRYTNPVNHRQWMMLAPSTIQSQVFQLGLEQINKKLSKESTSISDILDSSAVLEAQGLDIVILKEQVEELVKLGLYLKFKVVLAMIASLHGLNQTGTDGLIALVMGFDHVNKV